MATEETYQSLNINGTEYVTRLNRKYKNRPKWKKRNPKMVTNGLPGTVLDIYVKTGDLVVEGEKLLSLEAMKMINTILAPFSGEVREVFVKPGQILKKGTSMVELA